MSPSPTRITTAEELDEDLIAQAHGVIIRAIASHATHRPVESRPSYIARALADAGLLAHQAPATEDEAAEVEWAVRDRTDFTMPMKDEAHARQAHEEYPDFWFPVWRTPAGPWVEVSR